MKINSPVSLLANPQFSKFTSWLQVNMGQFFGRAGTKDYGVDEQLRDKIVLDLDRYAGIDTSDVDVEVDDGFVVLSGYIAEPDRRGVLTALVAGLPGVRSVQNRVLAYPEQRTLVWS